MYLKVFCCEAQVSISGFSGVSSLPPKHSRPLKKQASHLKTYIDLATLSQASFSQRGNAVAPSEFCGRQWLQRVALKYKATPARPAPRRSGTLRCLKVEETSPVSHLSTTKLIKPGRDGAN